MADNLKAKMDAAMARAKATHDTTPSIARPATDSQKAGMAESSPESYLPMLAEIGGAMMGTGAGVGLSNTIRRGLSARAIGKADTAQDVAEGAKTAVEGGATSAMVGGAMGGIAGRAAGNFMEGREQEGVEMGIAGVVGALGPAISFLVKPLTRLFTAIPSITKSLDDVAASVSRTEAESTFSVIPRVAARIASRHTREIDKANTEFERISKLTRGELVKEFKDPKHAAVALHDLKSKMAKEAFTSIKEAVPKQIKELFIEPELAGLRTSKLLQRPDVVPGSAAAAASAITAWVGGGDPVSSAVVGGAFGHMIGLIGKAKRDRLLVNDRFRNWVTGVTRRGPYAQAMATFIPEVLLSSTNRQEAEDAMSFFQVMMEHIKEDTKTAYGAIVAPPDATK